MRKGKGVIFMAMMQVVCRKCGNETPMRGWIEKEDLKGTKYEHLIDIITEEQLDDLERTGEVMDEFDKWEATGSICPDCGSKDTYWY